MNLETIVQIAGVISALAAVLSYRLLHKDDKRKSNVNKAKPCRETDSQSPDIIQEKTEKTDKNKKSVPKNIFFGTTLLRTPSLEEMGIPVPFAYIPFIKCHVSCGEWVERGDPLVTYTLEYYQQKKTPPMFFRFFFGDGIDIDSLQLKSPVSGFVTDLQSVRHRMSWRPGHRGLIDKEDVLPTILVPKHEPEWNNYQLNDFKVQICASIRRNWETNVNRLAGGWRYREVRLKEAIEADSFCSYSELTHKQLAESLEWVKSDFEIIDSEIISWPTCNYSQYKATNGRSLNSLIEEYRSKDNELRDKLVHLIYSATES